MKDSLQMFVEQHRRVRYFISEIIQLHRNPVAGESLSRLDVLWRGLSGVLVGHMVLERKWLFPLLLEQVGNGGPKQLAKIQEKSEKLQQNVLNFRVQWSKMEDAPNKAKPLLEESWRLVSSIEEQMEEEEAFFQNRHTGKGLISMITGH